jgi:hypothetical protein
MESLDKDTLLSLIKYDLSFVTAPVHFSVEGITAIMLMKILTGLHAIFMYVCIFSVDCSSILEINCGV